jgi:hypothetical protein
MPFFTVVAYRPNANNYGNRTSSDFEIHHFENDEIQLLLERLNIYRRRDRDDAGDDYDSWEVHLLIDGYPEDYWLDGEVVHEKLFEEINNQSIDLWRKTIAEEETAKRKAEEAAKKLAEAKALVAAEEKEKRERAEFARLKEKYEK